MTRKCKKIQQKSRNLVAFAEEEKDMICGD